ncbi:conserved hypothetical protein [Ricinus communis]|uniref:Uncharacterized protein n=1 Tax=Ricinus communis TaxID=3988 RepID=B9SC92_RICCO|nr:conserved hypothetical protein [Ricinus communis]
MAYEDPTIDFKGLTQAEYSLSCFLSGLKDEIKIPVKMLNPNNLQQAYALARMQDSYLNVSKGYRTYNIKPPLLPTPKYSTS